MHIGPTFKSELITAGLLGLPFSWTSDGSLFGRELLTAEQNAALDAVITAHDPAKMPAPDVDALRDDRLAAGWVDPVTGRAFQCDASSRANWSGLGASAGLAVLMGASPAPSYDLIAADNSKVTLSAADTYALINGRIMPWVSATFLYARSLKDQFAAGQSPDVTAGWP